MESRDGVLEYQAQTTKLRFICHRNKDKGFKGQVGFTCSEAPNGFNGPKSCMRRNVMSNDLLTTRIHV